MPELLTRQQVAEYLQVPVSYLNNLAFNRTGPRYLRLGHRLVRYDRADVLRWIEEQNGSWGEVVA